MPTLHQVLSVTEPAFNFINDKIALGSDIGQPVWDHFSFDDSSVKSAPSAPK